MKYLVLEDFAGQPVPFLFPDRVDHVDMREQLPYGRVLGAGYVALCNGQFQCTGGVQELDVVARPEDAVCISGALNKN